MADRLLHSYVDKMKYLVIYQDRSSLLYHSLRDIAKDIKVDSSTISKNLKNNNFCYCSSKKTNLLFYIQKL